MKSKRIESFHISNCLLGSGSFSEVYLGHSVRLGKIAVKVIPRNRIKGTYYANADNEMDIFEREVKLLNACKHEYIVELIDVKKTESNIYIFLEYCEGGSLAQYISLHNKLP